MTEYSTATLDRTEGPDTLLAFSAFQPRHNCMTAITLRAICRGTLTPGVFRDNALEVSRYSRGRQTCRVGTDLRVGTDSRVGTGLRSAQTRREQTCISSLLDARLVTQLMTRVSYQDAADFRCGHPDAIPRPLAIPSETDCVDGRLRT
jgi:hypothetical protein